jgi:hypothetical protein
MRTTRLIDLPNHTYMSVAATSATVLLRGLERGL